MIDLFLCTATTEDPKHDLRRSMLSLCANRWQDEEVRLSMVRPEDLGSTPTGFQRMRRLFADTMSCTETYIVADDDCFLLPDFKLDECVKIFEESQFKILSLMPANATIQEWTPEGYITENTPDIMEHVSVGGVRFCRKGMLSKWPPMEAQFPGYDGIQARAIRAAAGRVGYFRNYRMLHLGEGYSTVWVK